MTGVPGTVLETEAPRTKSLDGQDGMNMPESEHSEWIADTKDHDHTTNGSQPLAENAAHGTDVLMVEEFLRLQEAALAQFQRANSSVLTLQDALAQFLPEPVAAKSEHAAPKDAAPTRVPTPPPLPLRQTRLLVDADADLAAVLAAATPDQFVTKKQEQNLQASSLYWNTWKRRYANARMSTVKKDVGQGVVHEEPKPAPEIDDNASTATPDSWQESIESLESGSPPSQIRACKPSHNAKAPQKNTRPPAELAAVWGAQCTARANGARPTKSGGLKLKNMPLAAVWGE